MRDLKNIPLTEINSCSLMIRRQLVNLLKGKQDSNKRMSLKVASFAARSYELDLLPLVKSMPEIEWFFPQCSLNRRLIFRRVINPALDLLEGFKGIREPAVELSPIDPYELDVIITPGAGFSLDGKRLGFGGGFYDTLFSLGLKAVKVGVCLPCQVYGDIPSELHDYSVDQVMVAGCATSLKE